MDKLDGKSKDIVKENIEKLNEIFPEIFTEGKIDFERLKETLGKYVDDREERYNFTWNGKSQARRIAQAPSTGTLRLCKEESVNWDETENLFIEGDNLEVLKLLQKSYHKKVKMIYIDPPYNTGKDFIYKDNYKDNIKNYLEITGQIDSEGKRFSINPETSGRYHTDWLNMMYPRLKLARNLLRDDGVIFISIDDNEVHNLRKICDEIFGEENFIVLLPTVMNLKGNQDQFGFAGTHEYTLVFAKNEVLVKIYEFDLLEEELEEWFEDEYGFYKKGAELKATGTNAPREKRPNLFYPIFITTENDIYVTEDNKIPIDRKNKKDVAIYPISNGKEMSWRWEKRKVGIEKYNLIINRVESNIKIYKKQRPKLEDIPSKKPKSLFYKPEYSSGNGTAQIKDIFGERIFDNPKPVDLIKDIIKISTSKSDLILDLLAGSCTTADAILNINNEYSGSRKFIMIQLPEPCDEKSEAFKAGYKTIADIGKERIRRVIKKIESEQKEEKEKRGETLFSKNKVEDNTKLDLGFKVFKLDSSNIKTWDSDVEKLEQNLLDSVDNIKPDRSTEDVL